MDKKVDAYIAKQPSLQKEILTALRKLIIQTFPNIHEEMKWGVPTYNMGKYYIVGLKDHVNLGFAIKGLNKDEVAMFEGTGKTMRHIKIRTKAEIDEKQITKLLQLVQNKK